VVLDDGHVVGIGRHADLLTSCAVYREIAESQASLDPSTGPGSSRATGEVVA
jgi:ATP-binding cassette, subfamily B, multidrug efflux pump